jgi:hydrogenase-4 component B
MEWRVMSGGHQTLDTVILCLAVAGFGCKAGFLPAHFWLPGAHAAAPSPASALLSGVMLKTGIYGILRISGLLPAVSPWLGGMLVVLGCLTALYGIFHALSQSDYKRLLAYSSIENLGIIAMGVGMAWIGRATASPLLIALGLGGAILHVWNHFLFKTLLFHAAGAVLHATGTRNLERLGGLARGMPASAACALVGCLAVSALPPFNGFISEWLLYRGLFSAIASHPWLAAVAIPALAFTGGLAAATFVKLFATLFLGEPRDATIPAAHDPAPSMVATMAIAACLCGLMGILSVAMLPVAERVVTGWAGSAGVHLTTVVGGDLLVLGLVSAALTGVGAVVWWHLARRLPSAEVRRGPTWDCGYARPAARMQYTGRSLTAWLGALIPGLRALVRLPHLRSLFPGDERFSADMPDALGDRVYAPRLYGLAERIMRLRWLQQGLLHMYLLYVLIGLVMLFAWMMLRPLVMA